MQIEPNILFIVVTMMNAMAAMDMILGIIYILETCISLRQYNYYYFVTKFYISRDQLETKHLLIIHHVFTKF
jgi:hypothetical protein